MNIRKKILINFSVIVIGFSAISFIIIYISFSEYREEQFQKRQKEKITTTLEFLTEIQKADSEMIEAIDRLTLNSISDEKMLIFNREKYLIYSSIDDVPVLYSQELLNQLTRENSWIEQKDGLYDVIAVHVEHGANSYYGISKAYDTYGYAKLAYLRDVLIISFLVIVFAVIILSYIIAQRVTKPLMELTAQINTYSFEGGYQPVQLPVSFEEVSILQEKFNALMKKLADAFSFQKHAIHHISHELRTPIAVLVTELSRASTQAHNEPLKTTLINLERKAKSLGEIIQTLLDLAKIESSSDLHREEMRIDELIFNAVEELNTLTPDFHFDVQYTPQEFNETRLLLHGNERLLRQAFLNLLANCVSYSTSGEATIEFDCTSPFQLLVRISNPGKAIAADEEKFLFHHFFRGKNSQGKIGFGLGLVLTKKIIDLHAGTIRYHSPAPDVNTFEITLLLT